MLQIRPIERQVNPGVSGFLSGAGGAARGFAEAEELKRRRELERQQMEANQRRQMLAEQRQENQVAQFLARQQQQQAKQDREAQGQQAAGAAVDAFGRAFGSSMSGGVGQMSAADGQQGGATGIPEFDDAIGAIGQAVRGGEMTAAQGAEAIKHLGVRYESTVQKMRGDEIAKQLQDEVASGQWDPSQTLGVAIDVDGDGDTDPISDTPALLLQALKDGLDPSMVADLHSRARQAMVQHRSTLERRAGLAAEAEQGLAAMGTQITPEGYSAARAVLDKWNRGVYPATEQGEKEFKSDFAQGQLGNVPVIGKSGIKYHVPMAQAAQAELDLKEPANPEMDRRKAATAIVRQMLGQFRPDPLGAADTNAAAAKAHMATFNEAVEEMMRKTAPVDPRRVMRGPTPSMNRPGPAAAPESGPQSQAEAVTGDVGGGGPVEAPSSEPTSPTPGAEAPSTPPASGQPATLQAALAGRKIEDLSDAEVAELLGQFAPGWNKDQKPTPKPKKAEAKPGIQYKGRGDQ